MNGFHNGASSVQSTAQRTAKVGVIVDFQGAKLDRWVFLRRAQKKSEHPFRQQLTVSFGILPGMDQHHELPGRRLEKCPQEEKEPPENPRNIRHAF